VGEVPAVKTEPFTVSIVSWGLPEPPEHDQGSRLLHLRDLEPELNLARSAMLYADHVRLLSPTYFWNSLILDAAGSIGVNPERYVDFLESLFSINPLLRISPEFDSWYRPIIRLRNRVRRSYNLDRAKARSELRRELEMFVDQLERGQSARDRAEQAVAEINSAATGGKLTIVPVPGLEDTKDIGRMTREIGALVLNMVIPTDEVTIPEHTIALVRSAAAELRATLSDPNCYPLFDDHARKWLGSLPTGAVSEQSKRRATASGLAGLVMGKLPTGRVSLDELHQIRERLDDHLVAFRSKMLGLSNEVRLAQWDPEFEHEVNFLYQKSVAPEVAVIERKLAELKALGLLRRVGAAPTAVAAGGAVTVALAKAAELGADWLSALLPADVTIGAGIATTALKWMHDVWSEHHKAMSAIEQNEFYYYHQVGQVLADTSSGS
jgi:hypothetical protein